MEPGGAASVASDRGETRPDESRALTGLRAIAALLVMVHHFYLHLALDQHLPVLRWLLLKGYLGVDLFFVLSGFVLSMVYGHWFDGSRRWDWTDVPRFVFRRVARLWPVHAAVLALVLLIDPTLGGHVPTPNMVAANFGMIQAWGLSAAVNPPAWSVSTEFGAYLLFPVLAFMGLRRRAGAAMLLAAAAAALVFCTHHGLPLGPSRRGWLDIYFNYSFLPLLRCLAGFVVGLVAWRVGRWTPLRRVCATSWFGPAALLLFILLMLGRANDLLIVPVLPLIVLGLHHGRGPVHRVLARDPVHGLGVLSYSTYLLHYPVLALFPFYWTPLLVLLPVYLLLTMGGAVLLHRAVEVPGRRLLRRVAESMTGLAPGRMVVPAATGDELLQDRRR